MLSRGYGLSWGTGYRNKNPLNLPDSPSHHRRYFPAKEDGLFPACGLLKQTAAAGNTTLGCVLLPCGQHLA